MSLPARRCTEKTGQETHPTTHLNSFEIQILESQMEVEKKNDVTVIRLTDDVELDRNQIEDTFRQLVKLIDDVTQPKIVINLAKISFMASPALGILISFNQKIKTAEGELRLCHVNEQIYEVFSVTQITRLLKICDTETAALESF
jgi:stage II sporulation protein AA (anti-sigma F factor antagonist)